MTLYRDGGGAPDPDPPLDLDAVLSREVVELVPFVPLSVAQGLADALRAAGDVLECHSNSYPLTISLVKEALAAFSKEGGKTT